MNPARRAFVSILIGFACLSSSAEPLRAQSTSPVTVQCNGQPVSLKLCKPGNRACDRPDVEPAIRAAFPAGVPHAPNNQITFTSIPASGATVEYTLSVPNVGTVAGFVQNSPSTGTLDSASNTYSIPIGGSQNFSFPNIAGPTFAQSIEIDRQASGFALVGYTVKCTPKATTGKITLVKTSVGGTGTFTVNATKAGAATPATLATSGSPNGSAATTLTLDPGTYTISETAPAGWALTGIVCVKNSGTGSASGASVNLDAGDAATCTVTNTKQIAGLTFLKTAISQSYKAVGEAIKFNLKYTNTGTAPFTNLSISDPGTVLSGCATAFLAPGASVACTATRTATQSDLNAGRYDNTATLTATLPDATIATASARASVPAAISGGLVLSQTATPETYSDIGQTVTYTLTASNTSASAISGVKLDLPNSSLINCQPFALPGNLPPGATTTCTARHVTDNGDIGGGCRANPATATGLMAGRAVSAFADAQVCMTADKTIRAVRRFIERRVDLLAANEPDSLRAIRRFRSSNTATPVEVSGNVDGGNGNLAFKTSLSQIARAKKAEDSSADDAGRMGLGASESGEALPQSPPLFDIWVEANYLRWRDNDDGLGRSGDFAIAYIGADVTIAPGVVIGALAQTDFMTDHTDALTTDLNGTGWMAGPYVAMKLSSNLYFDARAAYGQSDNTVKPFGTFADHFETERWLARANLTGSWNFGGLRFSPSAGLVYAEETQGAFVDALGMAIPEQSAKLGRLTFGPEVAYAIPLGDGGVVEPMVSVTGMWDFQKNGTTPGTEITSRSDDFRMKAEAGILYHGPEGASLRAAATYDGIGSKDVSSWGGQLSVNVPLEQIAALITEDVSRRSFTNGIAYAGAADVKPAAADAPAAASAVEAPPAEAPVNELPTVVIETEDEAPPVAPAPKPKKVAKPAPQAADDAPVQKQAAKARKQSKPAGASKQAKGSSGSSQPENAGAGSASGGETATGPAAASAPVSTSADAASAASSKRRIVEQVASVEEITANDIEQRGARTLDEAIDLAPGVYVRNAADGVPRIDIRGLRTRNIQILLDGVPLNSTFDGQFDPRSIPVENIAKIKITKGGSSVLYGPGGNAAVIDIITKSAATGLHGSGQVQYSPERGTEERATASYGSKSLRVFLSASALNQDSFSLSEDYVTTALQGPGDRINSDRKDQALYGNFVWTPNQFASFGMSVNWRAGEYGKPPGTVAREDSPFAQRTRFERVDDFDNLSVQSSGMIRVGPGVAIRPLAYYNRFNEITNNYDDTTFATQVRANATHEDATTEIGGGGAQVIFKQAESQLTIAIDGHNESWQSSGFQVPCALTAADGTCELDGAAAAFKLDHDIQVFSASAEQELKFSKDLSAAIGAGYSQQRKRGISDDGYTYLAGVRYALTETTAVRGSVARKIRFPTLRDLYDAQGGNSNLETEVTENYEIGLEQQFPEQNLSASVALFHIDAENFIERRDGLFSNIAVLQFEGIETSATYRGIEGLEVTAGYTFLDSTNLTPGAGTRELQYRPEHKATLTASYKFDTGTTFTADWLYVAGSKALPGGGGGGGGGGGDGPALPAGPVPVQTLDSYHVFNFGLSQDIEGTSAELFGRVENAFDENYYESFGFPQAGRTIFAGVRAKF